MGADLYIENLPDETRRGGFEVSNAAVQSGYFRDCYNCWGLFSIMTHSLGETISWWQTSDRVEFFSRDGDDRLVMHPAGVRAFWNEMEPKIEAFLNLKTYYRGEYISREEGYKKVEITKQKDIDDLKEHARLFARFHTYAIELGSAVMWSV